MAFSYSKVYWIFYDFDCCSALGLIYSSMLAFLLVPANRGPSDSEFSVAELWVSVVRVDKSFSTNFFLSLSFGGFWAESF